MHEDSEGQPAPGTWGVYLVALAIVAILLLVGIAVVTSVGSG